MAVVEPNSKDISKIKSTVSQSVKSLKSDISTTKSKTGIKKQVGGFADFVRTQGIIGLAIGLAVGAQAGATVKAIVEGFINPVVAFMVGSQEGLIDAKWHVVGVDSPTINYWFSIGDRSLVLGWGSVLSSLITLIAVAGVIYFAVKGLRLDRLDKKKDK